MIAALKCHWPEYLIEAWGLGMFMVAAGVVGTILFYPQSSAHHVFPSPFMQRVLMGLGMGLTAMGIMYSPWGKRSGAHINPAVTLTFYRLNKIKAWDAIFYIVFQFIGGLLGVLLVALLLQLPFTQAPVSYVVTVPGKPGVVVAFVAEYIIAVIMMWVVLYSSNRAKLAPLTPLFAGCLIVSYVIFESPLSGFGMNPARTVASALPSGIWTAIWLYFVAPISGMLTAAELYVYTMGKHKVFCAKLYHDPRYRCIHCGHHPHNTR
ncbi:aquaporin [Chroococcus sp. FPU101]|uniref:aquaporin n=1 Tax=Chroococcus sp. FPU101 TaxID=1974212 RepID=UPI001A8CDCDE|nr:aquaporin [Chroococcus sp. FPU101]